MDKDVKICVNCEAFNGECNNEESYQFGSLVSEDYWCVNGVLKNK